MKFFAALIAKLTGAAEAPKTLDQARATFGEAKAAFDKVAELFTNAAIDLDALLAKGGNALKDLVADLQAKITTAETRATAAEAAVVQAKADAAESARKVSSLSAALASFAESIGLKLEELSALPPVDATAAIQKAMAMKVSGGVSQKMSELGVPASKLPKQEASEDAKTMTYEAFSRLSPAEKMNFSVAGGRLTDLPLNFVN
jgi:uncharacterized phage infection (PIP) family protein YhgE